MNAPKTPEIIAKKRKTKKIILVVLASILTPILILTALIGVIAYQEAKEKHLFEYNAMERDGEPSDELVRRGVELGLAEINNIPVFRIDQAKMYGLENKDGGTLLENCDKDSKSACKVIGIFIRYGLEGDDLDAILAHEYLHAMYARYNLSDDLGLTNSLKDTYTSTPQLSEVSLVNYPVDEKTSDEVFAYACTDPQDKWLTAYVLEECSKFIDRSKIVHIY